MFAHLQIPSFVEVSDHIGEFLLLEKVNDFETTDFTVVDDALRLPTLPTKELIGASQEKDETKRQETDNYEEHKKKYEKQRGHVLVFPKDEVANLFEEICDQVHPLQGKVSTFSALPILGKDIKFGEVVLSPGLGDGFLSLLAFKQRVDGFHVHNFVHSQHVVCRH